MMQFLGTLAAVLGIGAEVNVLGCPAENEIHPFDPSQNWVYELPKKQKVNPILNGPACESSLSVTLVPPTGAGAKGIFSTK
jgi:hypothetical protein